MRLFFNIVKSSCVVQDLEGVDLPTLEHARREAVEDARTLMSTAVLEGRDVSHQKIEICDEASEVLLVVPFTRQWPL